MILPTIISKAHLGSKSTTGGYCRCSATSQDRIKSEIYRRRPNPATIYYDRQAIDVLKKNFSFGAIASRRP